MLIIVDEKFAKAFDNCRRHFLDHPKSGGTDIHAELVEWTDYLNQEGITWDYEDNFFIDDPTKLSMFILRWC